MKDYGIDKGIVQEFDSNDRRKGNKFSFRKMFWTFLRKIHVPFYDPCCTTASETSTFPVRVEGTSGLQYFDGTQWSSLTASQGTFVAGYFPQAAMQTLTGAGAVNVTSYYTQWITTGANAGTLADGTKVGQLKKVAMITDGGDGTLTPANLSGFSTITFNDPGDFVELMWNGSDWVILQAYGVLVA